MPPSPTKYRLPSVKGAPEVPLDERPNVDFALVVLARVLGLPLGGALVLFA